MSGLPWFEVDVSFPRHPKTLALRSELAVDLGEVYVVRLWAYCYEFAVDTILGRTAVERIAGWAGAQGELVAALLKVGFLEPGPDEQLVVHGVRQRLDPHLVKLSRDKARMRERRAKVAATIGRTSPERRANVAGDKDKDKDKDKKQNSPQLRDPAQVYPVGIFTQDRCPELVKLLGQADAANLQVAIPARNMTLLGQAEEVVKRVGVERALVGLQEFARTTKEPPPWNLAYVLPALRRIGETNPHAGAPRGPSIGTNYEAPDWMPSVTYRDGKKQP